LFDDPYVAAVPAASPIARLRRPALADLATMPFIAFPKDPASAYASEVMSMLHAVGVRPRVAHEAIEIHTALGLVAAGLGFTVVGASVAMRGPSDVAMLPMPGLASKTRVLAVTRANEDGELVASMLRTLTEISAEQALRTPKRTANLPD
jgi:DNA-binding transcriptional LysR family regulator